MVHAAASRDARLDSPHHPPPPLRLHGGRSPQSLIGPSPAGRRVTSANGAFETTMEYGPRSFQHLAGITAYYNTRNWYFPHVTADDEGRAVLRVAGCDRGVLSVNETDGVPLDGTRRLRSSRSGRHSRTACDSSTIRSRLPGSASRTVRAASRPTWLLPTRDSSVSPLVLQPPAEPWRVLGRVLRLSSAR
ncbi:hypothetical protein ORI94_21975 [Streptomyces sp. NEAU-W12]|nr:hypothetical protein [Streptomyces sp. NEAU-W12]MCX2926164.1 hypothetical protein [Streptomyces sp. NEAU-W12]